MLTYINRYDPECVILLGSNPREVLSWPLFRSPQNVCRNRADPLSKAFPAVSK
jgi:hypothetical protein